MTLKQNKKTKLFEKLFFFIKTKIIKKNFRNFNKPFYVYFVMF